MAIGSTEESSVWVIFERLARDFGPSWIWGALIMAESEAACSSYSARLICPTSKSYFASRRAERAPSISSIVRGGISGSREGTSDAFGVGERRS